MPGLGLDHFEEVKGEAADDDGEGACFLRGGATGGVDLFLEFGGDLEAEGGFNFWADGDAGGKDEGLDYFVEGVLFEGEAEEAPGGVELVPGPHGEAVALRVKGSVAFQTHHLVPRT